MITFIIDEVTACIKDTATGEFLETEVVELKRRSFLSKFNKRNGWYVNWGKFSDGISVYALVLKGTVAIQGLVAVSLDYEAKAAHVIWACTAPHNNKAIHGSQQYSGVGGHLLAIASEISMKNGFDGYIYGEAINETVFKHYINHYDALPLPKQIHPFAFVLSGEATQRLREVYNYEWTNEIL